MNFGSLELNKKQLFSIGFIVLLVAGLGVGIFLVQKAQVFKPKASVDITKAFEIKDANGNILTCDPTKNPPECTTSTLDVSIRVKSLDELTK